MKRAFMVAAITVVLLTAGLATAQHEGHEHKREHQDQSESSVAEINVRFDTRTEFHVTSSHDISNVIIDYDSPTKENKKIEFREPRKEFSHTDDSDIAGIWVKSGSHMDADGPPGAGEHFDNPHVSLTTRT